MLRMRRQSGIKNFADFGVSVQVASDSDAIGVVLQHANGESLDATRDQEAIHGSQASSGGALDEIDFLGIFGASENHAASGRVTVAIKIFGHGVDDDVRAERDGALQVRAQERVVYDQ